MYDEVTHQIMVTDNGAGISSELIRRIFQDFYTTQASRVITAGFTILKKVMRSFYGEIFKCVNRKWTMDAVYDDVPIFGFKYSERDQEWAHVLKTVLMVSDQKILTGANDQLSFYGLWTRRPRCRICA